MTRNVLALALIVFALLLVSSSYNVVAQTGWATGEVKLCSREGKLVTNDLRNVQITAVRTDSVKYKLLRDHFTWGQCAPGDTNCKSCKDLGNDCAYRRIDFKKGTFRLTGLPTGVWIFNPSIANYSLEPNSLKETARGITINEGPNEVNPPRPFWLKERQEKRCPGEQPERAAIPGAFPNSTAASFNDACPCA